MKHRLFIEAEKWADNLWHGSNYAPLVAWDMREGTPWDVPRVPNHEAIDRLAEQPREMRGVMIPWFADRRLSAAHIRGQCVELAERLAAIGGCDTIYTDNEETPFDAATRGRLDACAALLTPQCSAMANWNSCKGGKGWWGPYDGQAVGTHSCPQSYEMTTNADVARWMTTIRACGPETIVHLPPCQRKDNGAWVDEIGTANAHARARQMCMYAAFHGITRFVFAEYMIVDRVQCAAMLRTISRCLSDCDRVFGEEREQAA